MVDKNKHVRELGRKSSAAGVYQGGIMATPSKCKSYPLIDFPGWGNLKSNQATQSGSSLGHILEEIKNPLIKMQVMFGRDITFYILWYISLPSLNPDISKKEKKHSGIHVLPSHDQGGYLYSSQCLAHYLVYQSCSVDVELWNVLVIGLYFINFCDHSSYNIKNIWKIIPLLSLLVKLE